MAYALKPPAYTPKILDLNRLLSRCSRHACEFSKARSLKDQGGFSTPLVVASQKGHLDIVEYLKLGGFQPKPKTLFRV